MWLHGASIGESLALLPLVDQLRGRGFAPLVTTGTRTSADVLAERLPDGVIHQYAPLDLPFAVDAFLDGWQPSLLLLAESEIWPNMLRKCARRGIPVALVNARLSERSATCWARVPRAARELFGGLALCVAQSGEHAECLSVLGAPHVVVAGNLKHDAPPPHADPETLAAVRVALGARPVVVAASTHDGEDALVLDAHRALRADHPDLLTILVPRHVARGPAIATLAARAGLVTAVRSAGAPVESRTEVLLADTVGEMGLWLRLATVAVIGKTFGKTFRDGGGQTPIEAAQCAAAIVHGHSTSNFADTFAALDASGGAVRTDAPGLRDALAALLRDPVRRNATVCAAAETVDALGGATARTLLALEPLLAQAAAVRP